MNPAIRYSEKPNRVRLRSEPVGLFTVRQGLTLLRSVFLHSPRARFESMNPAIRYSEKPNRVRLRSEPVGLFTVRQGFEPWVPFWGTLL